MLELTTAFFNPFESKEVTPAFSSHWHVKRQLAQQLRQLTEVLVTSAADEALLHTTTAAIAQLTNALEQAPRRYGTLDFAGSGEHGEYGEITHEINAVGGQSNPLAPGLNMWIEGSQAHGTVTCGHAYEGPPGFVHGGYIAAIFDQFLGMAQVAGGQPGMTGSLTIRYLRPTPLNTELELSARVERVEGRKTIVTGEMRAAGYVTATSEALFVRPLQGMPR